MAVSNRVYNYHVTAVSAAEYLVEFTNRYGEVIEQFYYYGNWRECNLWAESKINLSVKNLIFA